MRICFTDTIMYLGLFLSTLESNSSIYISGLFGLRCLYDWILGKIFNKVERALDGLPKDGPRKRVLIIDDDRYMKTYVEKWAEDLDVEQIYSLPMDESKLAQYDAIVVDGVGIGNLKYKEGIDFLLCYDKPEGQSVVYHSGWGAYGREREALERRGVAVVTKGSNPEKLVLAIKFAMMKKEH